MPNLQKKKILEDPFFAIIILLPPIYCSNSRLPSTRTRRRRRRSAADSWPRARPASAIRTIVTLAGCTNATPTNTISSRRARTNEEWAWTSEKDFTRICNKLEWRYPYHIRFIDTQILRKFFTHFISMLQLWRVTKIKQMIKRED